MFYGSFMLLYIEMGDIDAVMHALDGFNKAKWKDLARGLGLGSALVHEIHANHQKDGVGECLHQVLEAWLKQNHNVDGFGISTWQSLASAVEQSDRALAAKIWAKR